MQLIGSSKNNSETDQYRVIVTALHQSWYETSAWYVFGSGRNREANVPKCWWKIDGPWLRGLVERRSGGSVEPNFGLGCFDPTRQSVHKLNGETTTKTWTMFIGWCTCESQLCQPSSDCAMPLPHRHRPPTCLNVPTNKLLVSHVACLLPSTIKETQGKQESAKV